MEPGEAAIVARAVFAWFRWCGRAEVDGVEASSLSRALALAERWARDPGSFSEESLRRVALPAWLSRHMEVTPGFVSALQREPLLWLRARPGQAAELARSLEGAQAGILPGLPDALLYRGTEDLYRTAAFSAGRFEIQDISSQGVAVVCAPRPGETWWDACAGEGGKTLHLSDLMQNRGLIWASDRSAGRLAVLRRRAARAGVFNYRVAAWDGGERRPSRTSFDGVLVDAPCSGVGTWGRNPHARWTTTPADVHELAAVQLRLLRTAAEAVKPGGRLVYAVCTSTREETVELAADFAAAHPGFAAEVFPDPFAPGAERKGAVGWQPQEHGGNGMFVAMWRRLSR